MVTDQQVRRLFAMQHEHEHLYQASDAAGMSSKTARKYLKSRQLPSQSRVEHIWKTRRDSFKEDWDWIEQHLKESDGSLEGRELFEALQRLYPCKYQDGQLRTLQRRVKVWKALYRHRKHFTPRTTCPANGAVRTLQL